MFVHLVLSSFLLSSSVAFAETKAAPMTAETPKLQMNTLTVDKAHSRVEFEISHLLSTVSGRFFEFTGDFTFDGMNVNSINLNATANVASINTAEPKRDEHLTSADFFDAKKFPTIAFTSKKVEKQSDKNFKLSGPFTMKGITKDVTFDCVYVGKVNFMGEDRYAFKGTTKINRQDFKVSFNKVVDSLPVVGDEVTITLVVEATKKK